jgi:hypothetical protein
MKYLLLLSVLVLSACSTTSKISSYSGLTDTMRLIEKTEMNAPNGVKGSFKFQIKATGQQRNNIYLNTELDYRDRRSITISIHDKAIIDFTKKYGSSPDIFLINKNIEVMGKAKRTKIWFFSNGKKTEKYYFQTHIRITSINQINVLS